ncbi:MAG: preprotein translocase subunit SecE [Mariprofundaceae bacterium]
MGRLTEMRKYMHEVQIEAKKVTWPERRETVQTTLMVLAMVIVMALFLWGVDSFFSWLVRMVY